MNILLFIFVNLTFSLNKSTITRRYQTSTEKELIRSIYKRYETVGKFGRPVKNGTSPIEIKYELSLIQILSLDDSSHVLTTSCWPKFKWKDELINWNPADHNGIRVVRVLNDKIWTPDILLYNNADEREHNLRSANVVLDHSGETLWVPQSLYKSSCSVELMYFPFDTQFCVLEFGSWNYDDSKLRLSFDNGNKIDFTDYMRSNEWVTDGDIYPMSSGKNFTDTRLSGIKMKRKVRGYDPISKRLIDKEYDVVQFRLSLRRNSGFYSSILVIPCLLLSFMTLVLFWLPPDTSAKLMLGVNIFVSFFILLLLLAESTTSEIKNFPIIGHFYFLNMCFVVMTSFMATFVNNIHKYNIRFQKVPKFIEWLVIEKLGKIFLVSSLLNFPRDCVKKPLNRTPPGLQSGLEYDGVLLKHDKKPQNAHISQCPDKVKRDIQICDIKKTLSVHSLKDLGRNIRQLKLQATHFADRIQANIDENMIHRKKWKTIALICDRIFLIVYISCVVFSIIFLLPSDVYMKKLLDERLEKFNPQGNGTWTTKCSFNFQ